MKRNWTLLAAILVLLFSAVGNRLSARYKQGIANTHEQVKKDWDVMNALIENAAQEENSYKTIGVQAANIDDRITWESDSTNLLRWFDDLAREMDLHLANSEVVPIRSSRNLAGSAAFRPMRFELGVRNYFGAGDMHITVSCLMPVEMAAEKKDGEGS